MVGDERGSPQQCPHPARGRFSFRSYRRGTTALELPVRGEPAYTPDLPRCVPILVIPTTLLQPKSCRLALCDFIPFRALPSAANCPQADEASWLKGHNRKRC